MRLRLQLLGIAGAVMLTGFALSRHAPSNLSDLSTDDTVSAQVNDFPPELLTNTGFETAGGDIAAGWTRDMAHTGEEGSAQIDHAIVHSGSAALKLEPNAKNAGGQPLAASQMVATRGLGKQSLQYSGWVRVQGAAVAHIGMLTIVGNKPQNLAMLTQPALNSWTRLEGNYPVPGGSNAQVVFICWVDGKSGAAWFDDLSLGVAGQTSSAPAPVNSVTAKPTNASIQIDAGQVLRKIPETLYGTNMEWIWNGNGAWLPDQHKADPKLMSLSRGMGIKLIRYPGGVYSDAYQWKNGVGTPEKRPEMLHLSGGRDRSRAYFGTDEALQFAHDAGAELLITVNAGTGTAQEAADWVRYVNVPHQRVRYWEVGNELYLNNPNLGSAGAILTPQQYADRFLEFSRAMRAVDPTIKILAIGGQNHGSYTTMASSDWDKVLLDRAQDQIDYLSVHNAYAPLLKTDTQDVPTVYKAMLAAPALIAENLETIRQQIEQYAPARASHIGIAVTEWGPAFRFDFSTRYIDHGKTLGSALFAASMLETLMSSQKTDIANFWQLNDYSVLGWIGTKDTRFPPQPDWTESARAYVFKMFTHYSGTDLVRSQVRSSTFQSETVGLTDAVKDAPDLMTTSTLSADGRQLYVMTVNRSLDHAVVTQLKIEGFRPQPQAEQHLLNGTAIDANTGTGIIAVPGLHLPPQAEDGPAGRFRQGSPSEITITDSSVPAGAAMEHTFPAHSVTALVFTRATH